MKAEEVIVIGGRKGTNKDLAVAVVRPVVADAAGLAGRIAAAVGKHHS